MQTKKMQFYIKTQGLKVSADQMKIGEDFNKALGTLIRTNKKAIKILAKS